MSGALPLQGVADALPDELRTRTDKLLVDWVCTDAPLVSNRRLAINGALAGPHDAVRVTCCMSASP